MPPAIQIDLSHPSASEIFQLLPIRDAECAASENLPPKPGSPPLPNRTRPPPPYLVLSKWRWQGASSVMRPFHSGRESAWRTAPSLLVLSRRFLFECTFCEATGTACESNQNLDRRGDLTFNRPHLESKGGENSGTVAENGTCSTCGEALSDSAVGELCPRCLLEPPGAGTWDPRDPPSAELVAARLPRFEVERLLGKSALGAVYAAVDRSLGRNLF